MARELHVTTSSDIMLASALSGSITLRLECYKWYWNTL